MTAISKKGNGAPRLTPGEILSLITALSAGIGILVILIRPDMLGDVSALVAIMLAIAAGIPAAIIVLRRLRARRTLTLLTSELQALRIAESTPLLGRV